MQGNDWRGLELAVVRLLSHTGWVDVKDVGGSGDKGADILAIRNKHQVKEQYLFQCKAVSGGNYVGSSAINQALQGQSYYGANAAVIVTNGDFRQSAIKRKDQLVSEGFNVRLWNGATLKAILDKWPDEPATRRSLRKYQDIIVKKLVKGYEQERTKSLFVVATGLGKTVIASAATDLLIQKGLRKVLVLCHSTDLAKQLEKEFWPQINKSIPTRLFMNGEAPIPIEGINFGLYQTLYGYLGGLDPDAFDLIIVDEAHHALANAFVSCIDHLKPKYLIGMTATPWRSDGALVTSVFGEPVHKVSLVDGMKMGYLSKVDYRIMCDNLDWEQIPKLAKKSVTIRDLNKSLFIPQRDEAVISQINQIIKETKRPRMAIFSPSKPHAVEFAKKLTSAGISCANASVDDKVERSKIISKFRIGELTAVTSVDVLNEGIDVPDVNILVFLRATHSRRIFLQQLGRGLRIAENKDKVTVLDFVTDIRRLAAVTDLEKEAKEKSSMDCPEIVHLNDGVIKFSNAKAEAFIDAWLKDVTNLDELEDTEKLIFPSGML